MTLKWSIEINSRVDDLYFKQKNKNKLKKCRNKIILISYYTRPLRKMHKKKKQKSVQCRLLT